MTHRVRVLVLAALLLAGSLAALAPTAQAAATTAAQGELDVPLVGAAAAYHNGATYLFGGRKPDNTYSHDVWKYDHATGAVSHAGAFPQTADAPNRGRYSGAAVTAGDRIYYFGGATLVSVDVNGDGRMESVPKATRDIFEYNPATGNVDLILTDQLDMGTWGLSGTRAPSGKIYLFGGFSFDVTNLANTQRHKWVLQFDPGTKELTRLGDELPYRVQDAAVAHVGGRIYVMGGLSDHDPDYNPCPTYQYYNPQTDQQETRQIEVCLTRKIVGFDPGSGLVRGVATNELPYRVQFASAGVVDDKAYLPGGLLTDGSAATSIVEITVSNNVPTARVMTPVLPQGTFGQGVTSDGATVWAFGGRFGDDADLSKRIVQIDPRPSVPWPPRSASATPIPGGAGMRLTWEPPAYDGGSIVTGYKIYRSAVDGEETLLAETHLLSHDDMTVQPGKEYSWRITAFNVVGESNASARVGRSAEATTPGAVSSFQAYPGNREVLLRWSVPTDDGGSNITGYRVYRDERLIKSLGPSELQWADTGLENERAYSYVIKAYNAKGDGAPSPTRTVAPVPVPGAPSGVSAQAEASDDKQAVVISWMPPPEAVQRFVVVRAVSSTAEGETVAEVASSVTSYTDTQVERGRTYYYAVKTVNDVGESPPSEVVSVSLVRQPGAPQNVAAIGVEGGVRVAWQPPSDTGDAPEENLRYYVSRTGGGSSRSIIIKTDIEGLAYTDRTVTPGQSYTYTVTTLNPRASEPSAPATATPLAIENQPPTAILAALPSVTSAGDPVQLDASQSTDEDGSIRTYLFDFGDGTQAVRSDSPSVTHEYARNGTFTASVVVTDDRGDTSLPATARVVVGELVSTQPPETGIGNLGKGGSTDAATRRPGSDTPSLPVPAPGIALLAVALAVGAVLSRRSRR